MVCKIKGTTNAKSKFIPVSPEALEDCHYKGSKDLLCMYLNNNENPNSLQVKSSLGGSSNIRGQQHFGDLSAILIENMPIWAEFSSTLRVQDFMVSESKLPLLLMKPKENVTSFAGVPSWMLVLMNKMLEETGKGNLLEIWPNSKFISMA
jgi:hypothetical protein